MTGAVARRQVGAVGQQGRAVKTTPGPRRGPRTPADPAMDAEEWGDLIRRAYAQAMAAEPEPGEPPMKVPGSYAERLSGVIRRAYADGWTYGALERTSGMGARLLRRWAHYQRARRRERELSRGRRRL